MKLRKRIIWLYAFIFILVGAYVLSPSYLQKSLIYLFPGIEDYTIFENRTVDIGTPQPWSVANDYMNYELEKSERDTLEHYKSVAYLIIQNDSIIYEEYWDHFNEHSLSNSFSAAKSIVGLLIGAAIDDGYIKSTNQAVGDFIPEYNTFPNNQLQIKHLLTMSSGLNWEESYSSPFSMTTQAYYGENVNQLVKDLKVVEIPGKEFNYKSGDTQLLSLLLKNATGKTLSAYASAKLWKPLGAENEALWCLDKPNGDEKAYCCFNSNAKDFARLGKLILNDGNVYGRQVISKSYIASSIKPATHLKNHEDKKEVDFYGYQWWIANDGFENVPYARGIYGQYIFVLKEENAIVVRLGHERNKNKVDHHPGEIFTYISTAKRILNIRK